MNSSRLLTSLLCAAALTAASAVRAAEQTTATATFSDPSKPGVVNIYIARGELNIRGEDTAEITVKSSAQPDNKSAARRDDGLRVISTAASFAISEKNNVVNIDYGRDGWTGSAAAFDIVMPRSAAVKVTTAWGGEVHIASVDGDVEIKNMNGEVTLQELGGGALVETMNGEIQASFAKLPANKPLSFASMNGEVQLRVPADARANVRFRTQNGAILTDFDETALVTKVEPGSGGGGMHAPHEAARVAGEVAREMAQVAREVAEEVRAAVEAEMGNRNNNGDGEAPKAPKPPRAPKAPRMPSIPAMAGGKVVSGTLNGGGPDIVITTMNGDIVVRKN